MKTIKIFHTILICISTITFLSCSKESESTIDLIETDSKAHIDTTSNEQDFANVDLRSVTYELLGNFSGKMDIMFLSSDGFTPPDQIKGVTLPWQITYNVPDNVMAIGGFANGLYGDGLPNETAELKMYLDDYLIETVIRTADEKGHITLPIESHDMEFDKTGKTISNEHVGTEITYTLNGNFTGEIMLIYKVADGSRENVLISELPWEYTFQTTVNSYRASIYGLGINGLKNEEITFSLAVDKNKMQYETITSDPNGTIGLFPELFVDFN